MSLVRLHGANMLWHCDYNQWEKKTLLAYVPYFQVQVEGLGNFRLWSILMKQIKPSGGIESGSGSYGTS